MKFRKEEKFHENNPIHMLQTGLLLLLLVTVKPKQSQSQSIHFPGIASCLHLGSGGKTIVIEMYLLQWNVGQFSCHNSCLGNC